MTDQELLELAAKAVGLEVWRNNLPGNTETMSTAGLYTRIGYWNPLADDGDALRLAVDLSLMVDIYNRVKVGRDLKYENRISDVWFERQDLKHDGEVVSEFHALCPFSSTHRAIVRAAAEIGKKMQDQ